LDRAELLAQASNRVLCLGLQMERRGRSQLGCHPRQLLGEQPRPVAPVGIALAPEPGMPGQGVDPQADRGIASKFRQSTPEILTELREDVVGSVVVTRESPQVAENGRTVATKDGGGRRRKIPRRKQVAYPHLELFHVATVPCDALLKLRPG